MANEQELNGKNEYFEYVESRIENLESWFKKDEELKSLILKTVFKTVQLSPSRIGSMKRHNDLIPEILSAYLKIWRKKKPVF